jgi:predicted RNA-binding Zn ribbon-like protein
MAPLWIDFLNSDWHDPLGHAPRRDRLEDPEWLAGFLDTWRLPRVGPIAPGSAESQTLGGLRSVLQEVVGSIVKGGAVRSCDLAAINPALAARPVTPRLEHDGKAVRLRLAAAPGAAPLDALVLAILDSFAAFLAGGDPTRLRICENDDCRWVFYDETRSRTRRWCADSCGNLIKVRKFRRQRKKAAKSGASARPAATRRPRQGRRKRR